MPVLTINSAEVVFPPICPACQMPATMSVVLDKEMDYLVARQRVQLQIPYCDRHADMLVQANHRLQRVLSALSIAFSVGGFLLCGVVSYWAIMILPDLKIVPGDSFAAWAASMLLVMAALAIGVVISGGGLLIPLGGRLIRNLIWRLFDTPEASPIRGAIAVKSFDQPPALVGKSKLARISFTVTDPVYARHLSELNPGSTLTE